MMLKHLLSTSALLLSSLALGQAVKGADVAVTSGGRAYQSYLAAPASATPRPAVILLHSFNGLEQGYRDLVDEMAAAGYVTLALGWQTFEREPSDATVKTLVEDGLKFLGARGDVNMNAVGLTGFCAGGRYTMLLQPQLRQFKAGVAWYGFPDQGGTAAKPQAPTALIGDLGTPMLIIHGTRDVPSPVAGIYAYAQKLDAASKTFKLSVYQGEPHGFLLSGGRLTDTPASRDARRDMLAYFREWLK
ncbi:MULTISPECIES: dienelactone hydrolase family protein [unclassified Deinococcus]|uniref:dienelactone hydrolase family protein n=1 Tax=unclassified Deinococcus TaxID=2623546 RepID=UPI001E422CA7|nr:MULTISPECIES: dienelactone hydrolase family protein [unclassified Deinococcus]MCD0169362.1 dienelactone hydrolase family protein [Deinococcus sp. 23YEL01]MCD0176211.1 dienelactone hydrolase family protein [Deinococcus sp. 14RED07]